MIDWDNPDVLIDAYADGWEVLDPSDPRFVLEWIPSTLQNRLETAINHATKGSQ
jgi:hypothetical protein